MNKICVCGNSMNKMEWKHQWVCRHCGRTIPISNKKTNADHIRAMTNNELAEFIKNLRFKYGGCPPDAKCETKLCHYCWLDWLKQEADND